MKSSCKLPGERLCRFVGPPSPENMHHYFASARRLLCLTKKGTIPVECMFHDLWRDMRSLDTELADDILEPMFVLMRAQTDKARKDMVDFGQYLRYRERDFGRW